MEERERKGRMATVILTAVAEKLGIVDDRHRWVELAKRLELSRSRLSSIRHGDVDERRLQRIAREHGLRVVLQPDGSVVVDDGKVKRG